MRKKNKHPSISIVIATYNSARTIERCLQSIRSQDYPQRNIEIIIADGGSNDSTKTIARKYNVAIYSIDPHLQNAEYNKSIGIRHAQNEILAMIDHDNVLPHSGWLSRMVEPLVVHNDVVGVETLRYHYDSKTTLLDRYFALFGAADPLVYYMGKTDRLSYMYNSYILAGEARDVGNYYIVKFTDSNIPTIGANGFLVRRKVLMEHAQVSPGVYFDMDVNVDLIRAGFTKYAFVKDTILHLTGYGNILYFLKRRFLFLTQYRFGDNYQQLRKTRRYGGLMVVDIWKLFIAVIICVSVVIPFIDSLRGWLKIRDRAWFLHPLFCFGFVIIYSMVILRHFVRTLYKRVKTIT